MKLRQIKLVATILLKSITHAIIKDDLVVTLIDGNNPRNGRVEIRHTDGRYLGTVCDKNFDDNDATIICNMLGYVGGGSAILRTRHSDMPYGSGVGPIFMEKLKCSGDEETLFDCQHRGSLTVKDYYSKCHHDHDAGVFCYDRNLDQTFILSLQDRNTPNRARI